MLPFSMVGMGFEKPMKWRHAIWLVLWTTTVHCAHLREIGDSEGFCLEARGHGEVAHTKCDSQALGQRWTYHQSNQSFVLGGMCLDVKLPMMGSPRFISAHCKRHSESQRFACNDRNCCTVRDLCVSLVGHVPSTSAIKSQTPSAKSQTTHPPKSPQKYHPPARLLIIAGIFILVALGALAVGFLGKCRKARAGDDYSPLKENPANPWETPRAHQKPIHHQLYTTNL